MQIERVFHVDDELVAAFARLIPQLSQVTPPGHHELVEIVASSIVLVARETTIVGLLTLHVHRIPTGVHAQIDDVVVDDTVRGRGIGEALTRHAIELARDARARAVHLTSHPRREAANRLYQRIGFQRRETNVYIYKLL